MYEELKRVTCNTFKFSENTAEIYTTPETRNNILN
jgi:hypothetical protein